MSHAKGNETVFVVSLVNHIEDMGVKCFKNCLLQTNQFSTRYVLTKVLRDYNDHVKQLKTEMNDFKNTVIYKRQIIDLMKRDIPATIINKYDLNNLNFVEANKIAIDLTEQYIHLYQSINAIETTAEVKALTELILAKKYVYLESLKSEYERLLADKF